MKKTSVLSKLLVSNKGIQDRRTPKGIFEYYHKEFNFQLDPCTSSSKPGNLGTRYYFTKEENGLVQDWSPYGSVFVNPPFRDMNLWAQKCVAESRKGTTVVLLAPVKTDTRWWHEYALQADRVDFIKGRITFEDHEQPFIIGIAMLIYMGGTNMNNGDPHSMGVHTNGSIQSMIENEKQTKPRCPQCNEILYKPNIRKRMGKNAKGRPIRKKKTISGLWCDTCNEYRGAV